MDQNVILFNLPVWHTMDYGGSKIAYLENLLTYIINGDMEFILFRLRRNFKMHSSTLKPTSLNNFVWPKEKAAKNTLYKE